MYIESIKKLDSETIIRCTLLGFDRTYTIPFTDDASIENAIHCMAVMLYLKPTSVNDIEKFKRLEPVAMRLDVKQGINNCLLINDTYNSDINSLDIALDFQQSRRVEKNLKCTLILSDILQSGTLPKSLYKKVADLVRRKKIDRIIGIGRDLKEYGGAFDIEKEFYLTTDEFIKSPSFKKFKDELILIKGSRQFHFERISELLSLTPFSYHPEEGGYLQGGVKTDAGRTRIIPIHTKIAGYLRDWIAQEGRPTAAQYRALLFRPLAEELGCPDATPHWCRHTFATRLSRAGVEELTIKRLLGHSIKGDVTQVYIHPTVTDLARELRKLA